VYKIAAPGEFDSLVACRVSALLNLASKDERNPSALPDISKRRGAKQINKTWRHYGDAVQEDQLMRVRALLIAGVVISSVVALLSNSFGRVQRVDSAPKTGHDRTSEGPQQDIKNHYGIEMVYIPPGEFVMGAEHPAQGRIQANNTERPVHRVRIAYGFYMSRYEITQAQWQAVMGNNPSYFKGPSLPVESVSFASAFRFTNTLNKLNDGYDYRLPSEAEWEYACRGGTNGDVHADPDKIAWYMENSGMKTHPVGEKEPNSFGLYDMLGNVWELCADQWHRNYEGAPSDGSKWITGGDRSGRVVRGGSRVDAAYDVTSTRRMSSASLSPGHPFAGVRLVAVPQRARS
jgi:formylglycine-generating enzyme required for sulfatase activity